MQTSLSSPLISSLALALTLLVGCGLDGNVPDPADEGESAVATRSEALVSPDGIRVSATYQEVVTGTPTYGDPATSPMLRVHVEVDDAAVRAGNPGFDGLEQVFVRVPKLQAGSLVWESVTLSYSGQTRRGYYGEIKIDLHDSPSIWNIDWPTLSRHGVAIGLQTNLGVIWAQSEGHNFAVTLK